MSLIQSVRFLKSKYTKAEAREWLRAHGYNTNYKGDNPQYKNYHAFRQIDPRLLGRMYTKKNASGDILFIIASTPAKFSLK